MPKSRSSWSCNFTSKPPSRSSFKTSAVYCSQPMVVNHLATSSVLQSWTLTILILSKVWLHTYLIQTTETLEAWSRSYYGFPLLLLFPFFSRAINYEGRRKMMIIFFLLIINNYKLLFYYHHVKNNGWKNTQCKNNK